MSFVEQAATTADHGVILTVGFVVNNDRSSCVMPWANAAAAVDPVKLCADCVNSFIAAALTQLLDLLSSDCQVTFVQGEGMIDGMVPFRNDSDNVENFGTLTAGTTPDQAAGLIAFYENPADGEVGKKIRVAHQFIPGIPADEVVSNSIQTAWSVAALAFATTCQNGIASSGLTGTWQRYLAAPKKPLNVASTNLRRISTAVIRGYTGTQRRRLLPHG